MNSKLVLGFLGGLLVATTVYTTAFYVQSHRATKDQTETAVPVTPPDPFPEAPPPEPALPSTLAPPPASTKAPAKKPIASAKPAVVARPARPAPVEQAKVEAPP